MAWPSSDKGAKCPTKGWVSEMVEDVVRVDAGVVAFTTKVCPQCGQRLFSDMNMCFGCLYDFGRAIKPMPVAARTVDAPLPLDDMPLDEPGEETPGASEARVEAQERDVRLVEVGKGRPREVLPDEDAQAQWLDDEDGGEAVTRLLTDMPSVPGGQSAMGLLVQTGDVDMLVPLKREGVTVGRLSTNDVVLHARSVSREHVRFLPVGGGAVVEDLGATNPATVRGAKVLGQRELAVGDVVEVCGARIVVVDCASEVKDSALR